jgi:hypothetical protein
VSLSHPLTLYPTLPPLSAITVNPTSVVGGSDATGTVILGGPAPPNGVAINLSSSLPLSANVPKSVVVTGGSTSAQFVVKSFPVQPTTVQLTAQMDSGFQSTAISITKAAPADPPPPTAPTLVSPAQGASGVPQPVTLDWSDVANAASYEVQVDNSSTIAAPFVANPTVSVSEATLSAGLPAQRLWWRVRARNSAGVFGPFSSARRFTPSSSSTTTPASLSSVAVSPTSVVGGNGSTGTVTLTSAAPSGGAVISLSSSNTVAATVPSSVTIAAGATSATFAVTTSTVSSSTPVTISAAYSGTARTALLTVTPSGQAATLTVTATGRSGERVTSNPAGINVTVGTTGSASFTTGTSITLSVTNGRDAIWSGACSSGGNKTKTCTFTLTSNASVTGNVQ